MLSRGCARQRQEEGGEESRSRTQEPDRNQAGEAEHRCQDGDADPLEGLQRRGGLAPRAGTCNTEERGPVSPGSAWQHPRPRPLRALPLPFSRSEAKSCKPEGKTSYRAETSAKKAVRGWGGSVAAWLAGPVAIPTPG